MTKYPAILNPLWVVSVFLTFSETTVAIAATQMDGWERGVLVAFSVGFPIAVGTAFFVVLWKRPYVFYAPRDFSSETSVSDYVAAMRTTRQSMATVELSLSSALRTGLESTGLPVAEPTVEAAVVAARDNLRDRFVVVHFAEDFADPDTPPVLFPAEPSSTVQELLDYVWFALDESRHAVPAFTYGKTWVLVDREGKEFAKLQTRASHSRLLRSVGIHNGMDLIAKRLA